MEAMTMHRMPQFVRLLAILALMCGTSALVVAKAAQEPPPAKGKSTASRAAKSKAAPSAKTKQGKAAAKAAAKAGAKAPAKSKAAMVETAATGPHLRDPFRALISQTTGPAIPANLPPGKAGLMVSTLRVDGIVRGPNGMLAVVTNPQSRTYFLREGDKLYDGTVQQITMDGMTLKEVGKDPFGKPIERTVTKRIYPSAGEQ